MKQLAPPRRIGVIILCLLSDYLIAVNTHICEVGREKNQHNEWKWVLPYPDPCKCTKIIMGGVNTWTPIRPFVPVYVDNPLLSDDIIGIREHYGLICNTGTTPEFADTSSCLSGLSTPDSSAGASDTVVSGASISQGEGATTNSLIENDAPTSSDISFSSQGEASGTDGTEAGTLEHTLTAASGSTAAGSTKYVTSKLSETSGATSTEAGTTEHAGATASGSSAAESSTNSATSKPSETIEVASTEAGTSDHASTTASGSSAAESSTNSATSVPSETSDAASTIKASTVESGSTAVESSTSSATSIPRETNVATSTEVGTVIKTAQSSSISTSRSTSPKVCNEYLGMANGDIPDGNIAASQYFTNNGVRYPPSNGRLNGERYWACVESNCTSEANTWIQADIGYQTYVSGVITQGEATQTGGSHADWVTELKVSTFQMTTNDTQVFVTDGNDGQVKVFQANTDRNTTVTSTFPNPVYARIVRITCVSKYRSYWTMRFEILGCKQAIH